MEKLELLKKLIADIGNNEKYRGAVFTTDDLFFVIDDDKILAVYEISDYFISNYTKEEFEEVQRIEKELKLNYKIFLPYKGNQVYSLEELIEYYEDEEDEEGKIEQIEKLIEALNDEKSIFFDREQEFLGIFLNQELESGVAYVHSDWDHDESYYYNLPYSIGVYDKLYDVIVDEAEFIYPDYIEEYDEPNAQEEECDRWIEILSNIDSYILIYGQRKNCSTKGYFYV